MLKLRKIIQNLSYIKHNKIRKNFAQLENQDLQYFKTIVPEQCVITDQHDIEPHNLCFRKHTKGKGKLLLCPQNTQHVSKILKYCNNRRLAVVPQGGNTGLVGGSVPVFDQIILNLKKMDKIEKFDPVSSVASVESGVILGVLGDYLEEKGFEVPLDLGAKGSCQVGGNASTNAGGKYVIKYGSFRSHILGLQAVLPDGSIIDLRSEIIKDNTGFDLKQLFIGAQGTLGVITKLNIHCPKMDKVRKLMIFKTDKYQNIVKAIPKIKQLLGKQLNALECMDQVTYSTVTDNLHPPVFDKVQPHQYLLFVEVSTQDVEQLLEMLTQYFSDGIISNNENQFQKMWKIREDVAIAARMCGKVIAYDLSYNVKEWPSLVAQLRRTIKATIMGYGHIGDGNIHVNMIIKEGEQSQDRKVFEQVVKKKGSISAQHGLGLHKAPYLPLQKSKIIIDYYKQMKKLFDPNGIMNPYKYLPQ